MKQKKSIFAGLMLLLFFLGCLAPKAEFSNLEFDFGTAKKQEKLKHVFTFKNTGNAVLKIINIQSG